MPGWTDLEKDVVSEADCEEAAYLYYRAVFPDGDKSIQAIIRQWIRMHKVTV